MTRAPSPTGRRLRRFFAVAAAGLVIAVVALVAGALAPAGEPAGHAAVRSPTSVAPYGAGDRSGHGLYLETPEAAEVRRHAAAHPELATPEVAPLRPAVFDRPIAAYRRYAARQATALQVPVRRLRRAVRRGDRAAARTAWTAAYRRYLLLGAAYGALGALDDAIDGSPGGLRRGVHDPQFTGLHRIEHDLWTGRPTRALAPVLARLDRDVRRLPAAVRTVEIAPLDYATRAHEILEDAQRDFLSGVAAPWSGAGLVATVAAVDATDVVLRTLRPLLTGRGDALQPVDTRMGQLHATLRAIRRAHGSRTPRLDALTRGQRARLNGALGAALEALSAVPGDLETTLPPDVPAIPATPKSR